MQPYTPDLNPNTYALDTKRELLILQVCNNQSEHINNSPFFSTQKAQQIQLEKTP
jgi:hypothetical protein